MEEVGYRKIMISAIALITTSTFMFGMASNFRTTLVFYSVSLLARAVQGAAAGLIEVAVPSIIAQQFPNNNELY